MVAVEALVQPLQRALTCVTTAVLTGRSYHPSETPHVLSFAPSESPAPLGRDRTYALLVRHFYRLMPAGERKRELRAATAGYIYDLLDHQGSRVVGYHWHPIEGGQVDDPHLHVGRQFSHPDLPPEVRDRAEHLVRSHLPTELIVLPTILRLAINDFAVKPLRPDWRTILEEAERDVRLLQPDATE